MYKVVYVFVYLSKIYKSKQMCDALDKLQTSRRWLADKLVFF